MEGILQNTKLTLNSRGLVTKEINKVDCKRQLGHRWLTNPKISWLFNDLGFKLGWTKRSYQISWTLQMHLTISFMTPDKRTWLELHQIVPSGDKTQCFPLIAYAVAMITRHKLIFLFSAPRICPRHACGRRGLQVKYVPHTSLVCCRCPPICLTTILFIFNMLQHIFPNCL